MNPQIPQRKNVEVRSIRREVDIAWLAGILDGEGAISVGLKLSGNGKNYLMPKVRIYNTDIRMIQKVSRIYVELGVVFFYNLNKKRQAHYKNQMGICVTSQGSCLKILEAVEPHLANKQDVAKIMIQLIKFVQSLPKGGNTTSVDYPNDETFKKLLSDWNDAKVFHIDPSTTTRKAGTVCSW